MQAESHISLLGCGNMGRSLICGLINSGYPQSLLHVADPNLAQLETVSKYEINTSQNNYDTVQNSSIVIVAVKPSHMQTVLSPLRPLFQTSDKLLISIAAGITLTKLNEWLYTNTPIIRAMPNTPAIIQCGATGLTANAQTTEQQKAITDRIMQTAGITAWFKKETDLDSVTALSGSGPAYYFLFMEIMEKAAISMGLPAENARRLVLATARGAAELAYQSEFSPAVLRQQVTSPGGTTECAIKSFIDGGQQELIEKALKAAKERATEIGEEYSSK